MFQTVSEKSSTKMEQKAELTEPSPSLGMGVIMAALSQISSHTESQISQILVQMSQMSAELSLMIDAQLERQETRISKLEGEKTHVTSQLERIEAEVDAVKARLCELCATKSSEYVMSWSESKIAII